nr:hypothetical protein [Tanacetum cinerariifolium]
MELPAQNINHSSSRSMLEREKIYGTNFNDWFRQLRIVIRVEKKLNAIEQPIPPGPVAGATNQELEDRYKIFDVHNDELNSMFEKQAGVERFDLIQTFHACKKEERQFVSSFVLKMKSYVEQLERLGYVLPQDISIGVIMNGLSNDVAGFIRNYNMHNMGKTIDELHALLIEELFPGSKATILLASLFFFMGMLLIGLVLSKDPPIQELLLAKVLHTHQTVGAMTTIKEMESHRESNKCIILVVLLVVLKGAGTAVLVLLRI